MSTNEQTTIDFIATPLPKARYQPTSHPAALISIVEAGRLLGIGRSTTYELISAGHLEVVHIGRAARVPVAAVEELVERLRSGATVGSRS